MFEPVHKALRLHVLIYLFYLLLAVGITFPVIGNLGTQFIGSDTSDAYEMARHIWWFRYALQNGEPLFYQTNLGYPEGFSGVSLQADPLQFFPAWAFAFVLPLAAAYNLQILLTMALNGWAVFLLARDRLGDSSTLPALLAGAVFLAFPTFQGHLADGHAGLMVMWPVPLLVYCLFRLVEAPRLYRGWLAAAVLLFLISPTGHMLQTIYVLMPVMGVFLLARVLRRDWAGARRVLLVGLLGGVLLLLFLTPLIIETFNSPAYTNTQGYVRFSADLLAVASPSFLHPVFGELLDYPRRVLGTNLTEGYSYIGIAAGLLAVAAVWTRRRMRWWLVLGAAAWVLSLGPVLKVFDQPVTLRFEEYETHIALPWGLVQNLPGFNLARTPGRFTFTLALAVAMLAGAGAHWLYERWRPSPAVRWGTALALTALVLFEYQLAFPLPTRPAALPAAVAELRTRDDVRAVFNVPWGHLLAAKDALYLQTGHEKPLIAGQVTRATPVNPAKLEILQETLDPALLHEAGADVVIFHRARAVEIDQHEELAARLAQQLGEPFYRDETIALYRVPPPTAAPGPVLLSASGRTVEREITTPLYLPESGWGIVRWRVTPAEDDDRTVALASGDTPLHRWQLSTEVEQLVPLPFTRPGYQNLTTALEPPCPLRYDRDALRCRTVTVQDITLEAVIADDFTRTVDYEPGVRLAGWQVVQPAEDTLHVHLWWQFSQPRGAADVRFVHVLGADGQPLVQDDTAIGPFATGDQWAETVALPLAELPAGEYSVRVGWYTFEGLTRFPVIDSDVPGAQDRAVEIGTVRVGG